MFFRLVVFVVALEVEASRLFRKSDVVDVFDNFEVGVEIVIFGDAVAGYFGGALFRNGKVFLNIGVCNVAESLDFLCFGVGFTLAEEVEEAEEESGDD